MTRKFHYQNGAVQGVCVGAFVMLAFLLFAGNCSAQVYLGIPPFPSVASSSFDQVDLANANVYLSIPVVNKGGRGMPFTYSLIYNNSIWSPTNVNGTMTWEPAANFGWGGASWASVGYVGYAYSRPSCWDTGRQQWDYWDVYTFYYYVDATGAMHSLLNTSVSDWQNYYAPCASGQPPLTATVTTQDGSGLTASINFGNPPQITLYTAAGIGVTPALSNQNGAGRVNDPNGNQLTVDSTGTIYTDTLNAQALTINSNSAYIQYKYTGPDGATYQYQVDYTLQTVQTNFGCSSPSVHEWGPNSEYLVSSIFLPDGTYYTFFYEGTPGYSQYNASNDSYTGSLTGRLYRVTLPTGGTIKYVYSDGSNGITCGDGTTPTLHRYTPDSGSTPWKYVRTENTYTTWTTTMTDPLGDQTVLNYVGAPGGFVPPFETERTVTPPSGQEKEKVDTCYGSNFPCVTNQVYTPITTRTVGVSLDGGSPAKTITTYNNYTLPTVVDQYDYSGAVLRETITCYASFSSPNQNIQNRPSAVLVYSGTGNPSNCTGSSGAVAAAGYMYDGNGNLTKETHSTGSSSSISRSFGYGSYGVLSTETDYNGHTTNYSAPQCSGAFPSTITLSGSTFSGSINWNCYLGVPNSIQDINGQKTTFSYDNMGRLTNVAYPDGGNVGYTFNDTASPPNIITTTTLSSSSNRVDVTALDSLGRVSQTELQSDPDPNGHTYVQMGYDALGRLASVSNPYRGSGSPPPNSTTQYNYDALSRLTTVTRQDNTNSVSISYSGNQITTVDEAGKTRNLLADALGRVTSVTEDPNGLNYPTTYGYDALNDLTGINQSNRPRAYQYDWLGRMTYASTPEAGATYYSYVNAGGAVCSGDPSAVCQITDGRGVTTNYIYNDVLNRLTAKTYQNDPANTPPASYSYDQASVTIGNWTSPMLAYPKGRLTSAVTTSGGTVQTGVAFSYDPMGRPTSYWQCTPVNCGNSMWLVGYGYDQAGDVTSLTHPAGYTVSNSVGAAQRITQVSSTRSDSTHPGILAQNITYTPWGALSSLTDGCAPAGSCAPVQETYSYNNRMQLTGIQVQNTSNQSNYFSLTYNYTYPGGQLPGCSAPSQGSGNNGNVMGYTYTDGVNSDLSHTAVYAYDGVNRLACSNATGSLAYNLDYSYDAFGNMSCVINQYTNGNCTASTFNNSANRIDAYSYDWAGNVTSDNFNTYQWDAEERVATVDSGSSEIATYNALGQQARLNYPGNGYSWDQLYDLSGHWLGMYALGAWNVGGIFWLGNRGFGSYDDYGNTTYFGHGNLLQSAQITTDPAGNAAGDVLFYPWGINMLGGTPSGFSDFMYEDDTDWLLHTQNRQYTTGGGRWMSPDPAGLGAADLTNPQSLNLYAYALNNPTSLTDPSGLDPDDCSDPFSAAGGDDCPPFSGDDCGEFMPWCPPPGGGGGGGGAPNIPIPNIPDLPIPGQDNSPAEGLFRISTLPCLSQDAITQLAAALLAALNRKFKTHFQYNSATVHSVVEGVTLNMDILPQAMGNVPVPQSIPNATMEDTSCVFHSQSVCEDFPHSVRFPVQPRDGLPRTAPDTDVHVMYGTNAAGTLITGIRVHGDVGATGGLGAVLAHILNFGVEQVRNGACIAKFD